MRNALIPFLLAIIISQAVAIVVMAPDVLKLRQHEASYTRPPIAENRLHNAGQSDHGQTQRPVATPGIPAGTLGASKDAPLHVKAECEHGCEYSEDGKGWWKRLWTDPNATFACFVALFTLGLLIVGWMQWAKISQQIQLAREEFISTHRPKIELKEASIEGADILYMLANTGGTEATIIESWILAEALITDQPIRNLRSFGHDDLGRLTFAPGEIRDLTTPSGDGGFLVMFPNAARLQTEPQRTGEVHFAGAILYEDKLGNRRRSVFRRRWDHERQCFCRIDNPDYEYSD